MTLSTAAATGRSDDVVSSWKLDNSRTNTSGQGRAPPAVSNGVNTSSTASPMLPATTVARPAARHSAPVSAVTVVLPFVPVIASTFCSGGNARAKSSMSPASSAPRATAAAIGGWSLGTPGLIAIRSAPANVASVNGPVVSGTPGSAAASSAARGGSARVSATRTRAPSRARYRASDSPVIPSPSTTALRFFVFHLQRSFSVERPNRTSSIVTIQKRTTTWFSFHPFNSK